MEPLMFYPDVEYVSACPTKASPDYQQRFTEPCTLTYSDNRITSIFEGTGILPAKHPLERQFFMLRVPLAAGCGQCRSTQVEVLYASFIHPLDEPSPGEMECAYEVFCSSCNLFTYRHYIP